MAKLPNADKAVIPIEKLENYCLNADHPVGQHKAKVFFKTFGYTSVHANQLKQLIAEEILEKEAKEGGEDKYGKRYQVDFEHKNEHGQGEITTAWIIKTEEKNPSLTTCYVR